MSALWSRTAPGPRRAGASTAIRATSFWSEPAANPMAQPRNAIGNAANGCRSATSPRPPHSMALNARALARARPPDHPRPTHRHLAEPQDPPAPGRIGFFRPLDALPAVPWATKNGPRRSPTLATTSSGLRIAPQPSSTSHRKIPLPATGPRIPLAQDARTPSTSHLIRLAKF
jgi:hypothetical protein